MRWLFDTLVEAMAWDAANFLVNVVVLVWLVAYALEGRRLEREDIAAEWDLLEQERTVSRESGAQLVAPIIPGATVHKGANVPPGAEQSTAEGTSSSLAR